MSSRRSTAGWTRGCKGVTADRGRGLVATPPLATGAEKGNRMTLPSPFEAGTDVPCSFIHNDFDQIVSDSNGSVGYWVTIGSVALRPPFALVGGIGRGATLGPPGVESLGSRC